MSKCVDATFKVMELSICLEVTSWVGTCGLHYYGRLKSSYTGKRKHKEVELTYTLSKDDVKRFNTTDTYDSYEAGDKSSRFIREDLMIETAIKEWKKHFKKYKLLVLGSHCVIQAQTILDGPKWYKDATNKIADHLEENYDRRGDIDNKILDKACDKWDKLNIKLLKE